ncbi:MAG: HEPN domain-containing protein [Thermodesulfobacteriota bacterium]|nr:HEPN domain-containing protein [Thermodesulfobacteriota bacterium]
MKSLTNAWLDAAKNDLDVIDRIIKDDHLTHIVAFHAQQAVEKCFKALMEEHDLEAQKVHRLITLYAKIEIFLVGEKLNQRMMRILDSLYIDARYPGDLGLLPEGHPTHDDAKDFQAFAMAVYDLVLGTLRA